MTSQLLGAVLIAVAALYVIGRVRRWLAAQWFLVHLWRWFTGMPHHGKHITDSGWLRKGERALTPTGHATWWWYLPRTHRTAHRTTGTAGFVLLAALWLRYRQPTEWGLAAVACAAAGYGCWRVWLRFQRRKHRRTWLVPLHLAAHELAGIPRAQPAGSWITAELGDGGAVRRVVLELPPGWQADSKDEARLVAMAAAKTGIEAPEPSWRRAGQCPQLVLTHSQPPPPLVRYEDVAGAVERAGPHELVVGLGKKRELVKASLSLDSPHFAVNMGTGAGKSSLAAFWLMQELFRGAIAMVLDSKLFSQPWLFKDEAGEYDQLPNIAYNSSIEQLHAGMVWLGTELHRRNQVAERIVDAAGRMHGNVGPRLFILAEELNYAMPQLKEFWADTRDRDQPKKSPALTSFGAVAFAGRAVKMHLILIGQMLTAEVTGSKDNSVKENVGVKALARYGPSSWGTMVGKNVPMPPPPDVLGRVQLVTAGGVRETQTPEPDFLLYRKLAMSGTVTPCPAGMPGAVSVLDAPRLVAGASDVPVVSETRPPLGQPGSRVTLTEALELGIVKRSKAALLRASTRPGFAPKRGMRGSAAEYDAVDLAMWDAGRL